MMKALLLVTLLGVIPCLAFSQTQAAADAQSGSGVAGTIVVGPIHGGPVREGVPSTVGLPNTEFEVKQGDKVVTSFETDQQGHFKVSLPPGHYTVSRKNHAGAVGHYGPFEVTVTAGKMQSVHWECDTGLR